MKKALFLIAAASAFGLASPTLLAHTDEALDTQKAPSCAGPAPITTNW